MVIIYLLIIICLRRATADESGVKCGFSYVVAVGYPTKEGRRKDKRARKRVRENGGGGESKEKDEKGGRRK